MPNNPIKTTTKASQLVHLTTPRREWQEELNWPLLHFGGVLWAALGTLSFAVVFK